MATVKQRNECECVNSRTDETNSIENSPVEVYRLSEQINEVLEIKNLINAEKNRAIQVLDGDESDWSFEEESTVCCSVRSLDTDAEYAIHHNLSDNYDSDVEEVLDELEDDEKRSKVTEYRKVQWPNLNHQSSVPAYQCSPFVPKVDKKRSTVENTVTANISDSDADTPGTSVSTSST